MKNKIYILVILAVTLLVGCQSEPNSANEVNSVEEVAEIVPTDVPFEGKVCVILDSGGIDDKGYNQSAWEGTVLAGEELNWESVYLVSILDNINSAFNLTSIFK